MCPRKKYMRTKSVQQQKCGTGNIPKGVLILGAALLVILGAVGGYLYEAVSYVAKTARLTPTVEPTTVPPSQPPPTTGTVVSTPTPAVTPLRLTAGVVTVIAPTSTPVVNDRNANHFGRLKSLDPIYRSQGLEAWLRAAGITWTSLTPDARQIEEETSPEGSILAAGVQVKGSNISVPYPNCVTTDDPGEVRKNPSSRQHQPDIHNPSLIYTNVIASGTVTIWADCSNWEQLDPH